MKNKDIEKAAWEYACDGAELDSPECVHCHEVYGVCAYDAFIAGAQSRQPEIDELIKLMKESINVIKS